ncbi:MAG: tetratricopeptide repeat protein, partial [Bacteroidota bacterium]
ITTATDVYGLGLLLFEVLTGERPFQAESRAALEREILEQEPPRPSTRVASPDTLRALRDGLDAVCLRALAKRPGDRYPTAEAVADDLRRWLDGRPVAAHGPSAWYRARRFLSRHRVPVGIAVVALLVTGLLWGVSSLRVSSAEARTEAALADASVLEEAQGEALRILDPVARAQDSVAGPLPSRESAEATTEAVEDTFAERPAVLAGQLLELGTSWLQRGDLARADSLFARALALRRAERGDDGVVSQSLVGRGLVARARQDRPTAERFFREALAIERRLEDESPEDLPDERSTALYLASVLADADSREAALLQTLSDRRAALASAPSPEAELAVAQAHNELGSLHYASARYREALREFRASERRLVAGWGQAHPSLMTLRFNMAAAHGNLANFAEAERLARLTLTAMQRAGLGDAQQARARSIIGQALHIQDDLAGAERELTAALAATEQGYGTDTPRTAQALQNLAQVHASQGRLDDAIALAQRAARIHEASGGSQAPVTLTTRAFVASLSFAKGEQDASLETLTALSRQMPRGDLARPWRISVLRATGDALREAGRADEAESMLREVVAFELDTRMEHHPTVLRSRFMYGRTLAALGRLDEARPHLEAVRGHLPRIVYPSVVPEVDAEIDRLLADG